MYIYRVFQEESVTLWRNFPYVYLRRYIQKYVYSKLNHNGVREELNSGPLAFSGTVPI